MRKLSNASIRGSDPNRAISHEDERSIIPIVPQKAVYTCASCERDTVIPLHPEAGIPPTWRCACGGTAEYVGDREIGEEMKTFRNGSSAKPSKTPFDHVLERRTEAELEEILERRLELLRAGKLAGDRAF